MIYFKKETRFSVLFLHKSVFGVYLHRTSLAILLHD
jgi:hypothetical protein